MMNYSSLLNQTKLTWDTNIVNCKYNTNRNNYEEVVLSGQIGDANEEEDKIGTAGTSEEDDNE